MNDVSSNAQGTATLLAHEERLAEAKQLKIQELLLERVRLEEDTATRLEEIKGELKLLGYKIPRKKKSDNSVDNSPAVE